MLPFLLFAQAAPAAADAFADRAWAQVSRRPALGGGTEIVDIATDGADSRVLQYKLRLTRSRRDGQSATLWANSRTCPAVRQVLTGMEALTMPRPDAPGIGNDDKEVILDGVGYELRAPSTDSGGALTLRSNVGSSLAAWVDRSFAALDACWSAVELRAGG